MDYEVKLHTGEHFIVNNVTLCTNDSDTCYEFYRRELIAAIPIANVVYVLSNNIIDIEMLEDDEKHDNKGENNADCYNT